VLDPGSHDTTIEDIVTLQKQGKQLIVCMVAAS